MQLLSSSSSSSSSSPSPPPPFLSSAAVPFRYLYNFPIFLTPVSLVLIILVSSLLLFLFFLQWRQRSRIPKLPLPPGSMGWPYVGETLKLYTQNPNSFFSDRQKWYGDIFKTHILGCPCVMIPSPEAARIVLVSRAHLFRPTYPPSKEKIIGPEALFFHQGAYHSRVKKLVQASFLHFCSKRLSL